MELAPVTLSYAALDPNVLVLVVIYIVTLEVLLSGLLVTGTLVGFDALFTGKSRKKAEVV